MPFPYPLLTIDYFLSFLSSTIFSPFLAFLLPLSLRALATPYNAPSFILTSSYFLVVSLCHVLQLWNLRLAYGKPRRVSFSVSSGHIEDAGDVLEAEDGEKEDEDEEKDSGEVIVITGGASGLGRCIAEIFAMKKASVAVIDIRKADGLEGVNYYIADVGDRTQCQRIWSEIVRDLGVPTILINNAGIAPKKPFLNLTPAEIDYAFRTNTTSHFNLSSLFLPPLLSSSNGGHLVTISSILAHLGASNLSLYTAAKAALSTYHNSLTAELSTKNPMIKTLLVESGQLDTDMFADVKMDGLRGFVGPVVQVKEIAMRIVRMIENGEGGVIREPMYARWVGILDCLPVGIQRLVRGWSGIDSAFIPNLKAN